MPWGSTSCASGASDRAGQRISTSASPASRSSSTAEPAAVAQGSRTAPLAIAPAGWQKPSVSTAELEARMEWGDCWLAPAPLQEGLAAEVRRGIGGILPGWAPRLAAVPWVVRANTRFVAVRFAYMPPALSSWINLVVSQDNSCRYCYGVTRALLKVLGYGDAQIDRIERDVHLADMARAEQAALEFARKVSHANPRPTP